MELLALHAPCHRLMATRRALIRSRRREITSCTASQRDQFVRSLAALALFAGTE
jgi:hypothetical protein